MTRFSMFTLSLVAILALVARAQAQTTPAAAPPAAPSTVTVKAGGWYATGWDGRTAGAPNFEVTGPAAAVGPHIDRAYKERDKNIVKAAAEMLRERPLAGQPIVTRAVVYTNVYAVAGAGSCCNSSSCGRGTGYFVYCNCGEHCSRCSVAGLDWRTTPCRCAGMSTCGSTCSSSCRTSSSCCTPSCRSSASSSCRCR